MLEIVRNYVSSVVVLKGVRGLGISSLKKSDCRCTCTSLRNSKPEENGDTSKIAMMLAMETQRSVQLLRL